MLLWGLSAVSAGSLRAHAGLLLDRLKSQPGWRPADIGWSLARSSADGWRAALAGQSREGLLEALTALAAGSSCAGLTEGSPVDDGVVFVFPGQGSQWDGMAVELMATSPVFRARMSECAEAFVPFIDWSLLDVVNGVPGAPSLERTDVVQPVLFSVMVSLAALWRSYGVEPSAVLGHSLGEVVAAVVADALSLEDGARVAALWSRLQATLSGEGAMISVPAPVDVVRPRLTEGLEIAAVNGPRAVIVSGDADAVARLLEELVGQGIAARTIGVDLAAHSAHIDRITPQLREALAPLRPRQPSTRFYSSVDARVLPEEVLLDADYWCRNLRSTIQFEPAVRAALADGHGVLLEVSPHPVLTAAIQETVESAGVNASVRASLRRGRADMAEVVRTLGELYVDGVRIDWHAVYAGHDPRIVDLPEPAGEAEAHPESSLRGRLAGMSVKAQRTLLVELVCREVGALLGSASVDQDKQFRELGFDSVTALEVRNRISAAVGTKLPATMVFDHPTPAEVAEFVRSTLMGAVQQDDVQPVAVQDDDPIVIVGMGCRYPGGVGNPDDLWRLLSDGTDAVSRFPDNRGWDFGGSYDGESRPAGTFYQREAGFLHGADMFDAGFFTISPREAAAMDPQQRLLLETSWEAFEHAGIAPASLRGSRTGVFVGAMTMDYGPRLDQGSDVEGYLFTGNTGSVMSGRMSYLYGFEGPAVTVDTACSSSLVALHLAVQAVRRGECSLALAAGVTVMSGVGMFVEFSRQGGLAPDGRSKAFSDDADGFGLAEGVGVVLVERLSDARRNGHQVLAVVRGSAINQDGASNGMTAPSGRAQQRVIRAALANAGLAAADVDAVEAHGTGTTLGDPIEAQALLATYGQDRDRPLLLGSLKSNIGHTQAAAGVGGVIKMIQAMRHGVLPRTLHVTQPSSHVDWSAGAVDLLTRPTDWPEVERPRRAGVSSFGVSGTNAHVVLEQAPEVEDAAVEPATGLVPLVLSARDSAALRGQAARMLEFLDSEPSLDDVAYTAATHRSMMRHRAVVLGEDLEQVRAGLVALADGSPAGDVVQSTADTAEAVFVFPGQGSQWAGMAVDLMTVSPVFAARMSECAAALGEFTDWDLFDVLGDADALERVDVVQPALFAVMVSLAALWRSHGVEPAAVIGHSQGEIAAACVAGALSLPDAARVVVLRSQAIRDSLAGHGGMVAVPLPAAEVTARLAAWGGRVSVAAINGPQSTVVSGDPDALDELVATWDGAKRIRVDYASHSAQVEAIRDELLTVLAPITPQPAGIPFFSTVTGEYVDGTTLDAEYWYENLRRAVRFDDAVQALNGHVFIECSPHPVLTPALDTQALGSLRRDGGGIGQFVTALAEAHVHGVSVDWRTVLRGRRVDLPTYAFQRSRYWLDSGRPVTAAKDLGLFAPDHPLLGAAVALPESGGFLFTSRIDLTGQPWLADHAVHGVVLLPGTAFVELAVRAGDQVGCDLVEELLLESPLLLPADRGAVRVQVTVTSADESGRRRVTIHSLDGQAPEDADWTLHATGVLASGAPQPIVLADWPPAATEIDVANAYETLSDKGYQYGPAFRGLRRAWRRGEEIFAEVALADRADGFGLHPALLDAALHALMLDADGLPFEWRNVALHSTGASSLRVRVSPRGFHAADDAGNPVLSADSLALRPIPAQLRQHNAGSLLAIEPVDVPRPADVRPASATVIAEPTAELVLLAVQSSPDERLVVVTSGAGRNLEQAAIRGLVRSASSEQPGRFVLVDTDRPDAVDVAEILATGEPELWIRAGRFTAPRLRALEAATPLSWTADDCVLITGGTGTIGAAVARHLAQHGVRLVLVSRSGLASPGARELRAELGAEIVSCDVSDRQALAAIFDQHSINAVVHAAAVLDDGVIESLTPERLASVRAPKTTAAVHLHELTRDRDMKAFVLFSSVAGVLGTPGQANYAAANSAVDALAEIRRAEGLPATSIAWGLWSEASTMTGDMTGADRARLARLGVAGMSTKDALALFDASLTAAAATVTAVQLDHAALRAQDSIPSLLRGIVRHQVKRNTATQQNVAHRIAAMPAGERHEAVLRLVRHQVASVLGHGAPGSVDTGRAFKDMGFDSLTAVELRNRLNTQFEVRLPATLVFDHPTPAAVAEYLVAGARTIPVLTSARTVTDEPIAIVGMSCRYPGGVRSPEDLWRLVETETDAIGGFPADRGWDLANLFDPDPERPGRSYTSEGGFLLDAALFDATFFGVSPREATAMDPQQRLLLETSWEAFERAGIDPDSMRGSRTGVFAGVMNGGYGAQHMNAPSGSGEFEGYLASGTAGSVASGRVAYALGLEGPALTVDTACSSSLVALHLAVQALRRDECEMALAGGVTVMSSPWLFVEFSRQRGLSPDGRCRSFAAAADGTGWSEGAGVLLLERLSDARRKGHRVLAVVRGTAVNQDGASNGLASPNGPSQQRVIRAALAVAGLSTSDVDAVEAHGTGTRLGDPIEAQAVLATYGQDRDRPLLLGSLKSNIGHAQAAAGVGGIIKMVEAMRHGMLPRTLHVDEPTPQVDWSAGAVSLLTEPAPWPSSDRPRRAGVSSFGVSGTNAHVIIEEAEPAAPIGTVPQAAPEVVPWMVSARTGAALTAQIDKLTAFAADTGHTPLDIGYSLATTRARLPHRAVILGDEVITGDAGTTRRVALVFPGQGSQWAGMAVDLAASSPVFAARLAECAHALGEYVDWDLFEVLGDAQALERVDMVQPALFAVMVSLAALWRSYGVEPAAVVGHSQGEIAAACVAGALSLDDAARVVALRSQAISRSLAGRGGMVSIPQPVEDVRALIKPWDGRISIAAVNGPASTVVSGEPQALQELAARTESRVIPVDYASHSVQVEALEAELAELLAPITPSAPTIPFYSAVTGQRVDTAELDAGYWYRNLRETVRFDLAVQQLIDDGIDAFIESSTHPVLTIGVTETVERSGKDAVVLGTLRRDDGGLKRFLTSAAEACTQGVSVDWSPAFAPGARVVDLPTYAFQRTHFWLPAPEPAAGRSSVDGWRYRIDWRPVGATAARLTGNWLVLAGEDTEQVARALTAAGANPVFEPGGDIAGVVAFADTLAAALTLMQTDFGAPLWIVTSGAVHTGEPDVERAGIWGLGRVAALELGARWGGLIDLDGDYRLLAAVLVGSEDQVAVRGSQILGRRLVRAQRPGTANEEWQPSGPVLITGGTGAIGAHIARQFAARGAGHLVLTSRRGPQAPGAAELEAELTALGARVTIAACDVADRDTLAELTADIGPIRTVVHAAGVPHWGDLRDITEAEMAEVLAGKVTGAQNLDSLFDDLDAFVLISSNAGVWGGSGQGAYAAANAMLDAIAVRRRARGQHAVSLAWGSWAGDGMAAGDAGERFQRLGLNLMPPAEALSVLGQALTEDETFLAVADIDWARFAPTFTVNRPSPLLSEIPEARSALTVTQDEPATLSAVPEAERLRTVRDMIRTAVRAVLGHSDGAQVVGRTFKEMGFDSLTAVDLRTRLSAATGLKLPSSLVFDHPTPEALTQHLIDRTSGASRPATLARTRPADEPVAIVAMSCRYPGGVESPEDLWRLVEQEVDAITGFPRDRGWDVDGLYHPDPDHLGTTYTRHGGFLDHATEFDAAFFRISPREATAMDPQQRLVLETAWEAFERAGLDPVALRGTSTGVFIGSSSQDYGPRLHEVPGNLEGHFLTGSLDAVISGRVAYELGLEGPAMTVDTACSSSLVALHLAVQALRRGECEMALAGGVAVLSTPGVFLEFSRQRGLSTDGRCRSFSAEASGTGWAEGAGMLVLERLSDAQRAGHPVLAVVRGSAINQDGASNGLTAPNGPAQQRVIRAALADAGLSTSDVDAVEAHGTGTTLGDPIEAEALLATYGQDRRRPLLLGTLKSNIGHSQAASGVGGIIKMVQAMRHGVLPRTLHVAEPTSHVDWSAGAIELLTEQTPWPESDRPRRAGVSAFGVSGTNAHVVLEHVPAQSRTEVDEPGLLAVPLSARTSLAAQAEKLQEFVDSDVSLSSLALSLGISRSGLPDRAVVLAEDRAELLRNLDALAHGANGLRIIRGTATDTRLAALFTGQGSQRVQMGQELAQAHPRFAAAFDAVAAELDKYLDRPLRDVLTDAEALDDTGYTQPALFAVEVALFRLLESWGVRPDFLVGHSIGELAAAHVADVFSLPDAAKLVAARGRLMRQLPPGGAMIAIQSTEDAVVPLLASGVSIAAVNGPDSVVISGDEQAVVRLAGHFADRNVRTKRIRTSHAFHSHRMDDMLAEFRGVAESVTFRPPSIPIVSTLTGTLADMCSPDYWVSQIRGTVRFHDAVAWLIEDGVKAFVELGPDAALSPLVDGAVPVLRRDRPEVETALTAVATLHVNGVSPDWAAIYPQARRIDLPTYAFQRQRYWIGSTDQSLVATTTWLAESDGVVLTGRVSAPSRPWIADHRVLGTVVLPGTAFVELAVRAAGELGCAMVEDLVLEAPLVFHGDTPADIQVRTGAADESGRRSFTVHSRAAGVPTWTRHATGSLTEQAVEAEALEWPPVDAVAVDLDEVRATLVDRGYDYGPAFSGLRAAWQRGEEWFAEVTLPENVPAEGFVLHPALLDTALQPRVLDLAGRAEMPFSWQRVSVHATGATTLRARTAPTEDGFSLQVDDADGRPVLTAASVIMRPAAGASSLLLTVEHVAVTLPAAPAADVQVAQADDVLGTVQRWLSTDSPAPLVINTHNAEFDAAQAAAAGLVRSAQAEHPGRLVLVDSDVPVGGLLPGILALGEPEVVVRGGDVFVPRLKQAAVSGSVWTPDDCVLITGASGALGGLVARHLVEKHGVRRLVLVSRRGVTDTGELDADVTSVACDVTDRDAVARLLAEHPVTAVVHAAGVLDDGLIESLTPERMAKVHDPKVLAAQHLDELTRDRDLTAFVLFSSAAGVLGTPGQGNYAAANAALGAIARARRAEGLPATSLAWGMWAQSSAMTAELSAADRARFTRSGLAPLSTSDALGMLDAGAAGPSATYVAARLDTVALGGGQVPTLMQGLVRRVSTVKQRPAAAMSEESVRQLVRHAVADVLGHQSAHGVDVGKAFKELGFDSLTAVELRNRLNADLGLRLPATVVFDHPTPADLTTWLLSEVSATAPVTARDVVNPDVVARDSEPIAIVGMSCRYPGGVSSPDELWQLVLDGREGITGFPEDRGWNLDELFGDKARNYVRSGGFLPGAADFDPGFFGISPREAVAMDPQQRLLLEASWEAIERAGIDPASLRGSQTGVFAGVMAGDYAARIRHVPKEVEGFLGNGSTGSITSGRISYVFGLEGPALTIDTACSASLVAMHLAAQSLRRSECTLALAGGVTVFSTPLFFEEYSRQGALSRDAVCKSFSADADGTNGSEGVGMVLLERLSDARRNGHQILAVLRGSAVNQDGASNGLTAPSGRAQQRVIRAALADAGLQASDVDVVEAHGTGTRLGDPIEAQALLATYGQDRVESLWLGSLKSNIGHTQAAAGVGGVIKMVQALRHGVLPRTLHVTEPTSQVDWSAGKVELLTEQRPWPSLDRPRRAAVSGFGVSGTNAHVILEQAPPAEPADVPVRQEGGPVPLVLSARDAAGLRGQATRMREFLAQSSHDVVDVAWSALTTRPAMAHRAVVLGDRDDVLAGLTALAEDTPDHRVVRGHVVEGATVFVFPGQGSQWTGMALELVESSPVFTARMSECAEALKEFVSWDLFEVLGDEEALRRVDVVQPVLFAVMVSLAALWRSYGVDPAAVVGHSQGEVAAAVVAGGLSLVDAVRIVVLRSRLIGESLAGLGGMVSVPVGVDEVRRRLVRWGDRVSVAAVNGRRSTVVSGDVAALSELVAQWDRAKWIPVDYASHSAQVDVLRDRLVAELAEVMPRSGDVPFYSSVTGGLLDTAELTAEYWFRNLRSEVDFAGAVEVLLADGHRVFIESSAHPVLGVALQELVEDTGAAVLGSLRRGEDGRFLTSLAEAYAHGLPVDWGFTGKRVDLPTYAFQHRRYWLDAGVAASGHAMLGSPVQLAASDGCVFTADFSARTHPWLNDHMVHGSVTVPGAAFVDWAIRAGDETGCPLLEELTIVTPLVLAGPVQIQVTVQAAGPDGRRPLAVHARAGGDWTLHATGTLAPGQTAAEDLSAWPPIDAESVDLSSFYDELAARHLQYGPAFQGVQAAWRRGDEVFAEIQPAAELVTDGYGLHPALLDAALHSAALISQFDTPKLPFSWSGVSLHAVGASALRVRITASGEDGFGLLIGDSLGQPVASVDSLAVRPLTSPGAQLYRPVWTEVLASSDEPAGPRVIVGDVQWPAVPGYVKFADLLAAVDAGTPVPQVVFAPVEPRAETDLAVAARGATGYVLELIQAWLADHRFAGSRMVFVTQRAAGADLDDLAVAPVWGLVRSAQSEHPGRFQLVDTDGSGVDLLQRAPAFDEPQLVLRDGIAYAPRLDRVHDIVDSPALGRTVLVTGGTGTLGGLVAQHLAAVHGVERLVLASRRGMAAPGANDLVRSLEALSVEVTVAAVDVSDADELTSLLADHPVDAAVHVAGALADGLIEAMTPDRVDAVFKSKVDAAIHLAELVTGPLVLFSSAAGLFGTAGQSNYAAANAFLDALAVNRRAAGRRTTSIAWGLWEQASELTAGLDTQNRQRMADSGIATVSTTQGLAMFDAAIALHDPTVVAVPLDTGKLRQENLPAQLRTLVRPTVRRDSAEPPDTLAQRVVKLPLAQREKAVVTAVLAETAAVLGYRPGDAVTAGRDFKELGFDSLTAVELRNRLMTATGLRLPASLVFDYPNPRALAGHLLAELVPVDEDADIRATLATIPVAALRDSGLLDRLLGLAGHPAGTGNSPGTEIDSMDADALIAMALGDA